VPRAPDAAVDLSGTRRVGIVLLSGIGDAVHGLPIANDLKRADPERAVLWVAEPAAARVLERHAAVDEVVVFHKQRGARGVVELAAALRGRPCDVTLNLQRYFKSVFPTVLSGAPVRVGLPRSKTRDGVSLFHTHHLSERGWCHTQDLFLGFRGALGLPVDGPVEWGLRFSDAERAEQARFFDALPGRVAGVVLASANPKKDWPAERWPALLDALEHDLGYRVVLIGGPSARERAVAELVIARTRSRPVLALSDSVRRMMWLVDGVDLLVSPDTGPLHVAHALGTPVVGLFGHTNPARVGPWRRFRDLVIDRYTEPGAAPDPSAYAPRLGRMETIRVEDVLAGVAAARARYGARKQDAAAAAVS
jgi:heptosyltransferase I